MRKEDHDLLQENLSLARQLGAEVITIAGTYVAEAIQKVCHDRNVTQIVIGRPDRRFLKDFLARGTLLDQLVRMTSKIDIHVIRAGRVPRYRGWHFRWPTLSTEWTAYYNTFLFVIATSFFCYAVLPYVGYQALGSVFLLAILTVASLTSRGPIIFAATFFAFIWNFFFIPPTFTLVISSWEDFMMVLSFFVTASVGGLLTSRIRRQEGILQNREEQTRLLYELVQDFSGAKDLSHIRDILVSTIERQFKGSCAIFFVEKNGKIEWSDGHGKKLEEKDLAVAQWAFENNKSAGWSTLTLSGSSCLCLPIRGNTGVVGILAFIPVKDQSVLSIEKENFLETVLSQAAITFERFQLSEAAENARLYKASETLHQTLLNSVSHELRTPITALIGSATALKDETTITDPQARVALTDELVRSAHRLDRVVENLLDLSRLQKGTLQLKKEWFDLADVYSWVRADLKDELGNRTLELLKSEPILVEADFLLLSHAVGQILLNAIKYSLEGSKVEVEFLKDMNCARILVRDEGSGIPIGMENQIFEKFFRLPGTPSGGLGLGLTIVNNIVELHDGKVSARNRTDKKGSIFEISIPWRQAPAALQEAMK